MSSNKGALERSRDGVTVDWREHLMLNVFRILRVLHTDEMLRLSISSHLFTEYFKGMEKVQAVREIFGEGTDEVLRNLKIDLTWIGGYMWVNSADGHLMISSNYLNHGDRVDIYLDLIHELVHVKQLMEGKELFDFHYSYTARPTEIEAYRVAVREARRLGLSDEKIRNYLKTEWMSDEDLRRLAKTLNVNCKH
ncbi:MAG: hypothetical protein ABSB28_08235 [Candidatus Bathyarchaeia archaeon]